MLLAAATLALVVSVKPFLLTFVWGRFLAFGLAFAPGVILTLSAAGFGDLLVRHAAPALLRSERLLFAFACGIGLLSSGAWALGMAGIMTPITSLLVAAAGIFCGFPLWRELALMLAGRMRGATLTSRSKVSAALTLLIAIVAVMLAAVSLTPPLLFDVTEYHLGAWTDYNTGHMAKFIPMPHNFYARFPFPTESIYFLGLSLAPYYDSAPKIFNSICVLMCGLVAGLLTRRLGFSNRAGLLAALVAVTHPVMLDVSLDALIDAPAALLVSTSVYACFIASDQLKAFAPPANAAQTLLVILALVLFGTALSSKYTVAQIYLLPWCLLCLPLLYKPARLRPIATVAGIALAAVPCLLWFGKNVYFYGNPLEPFFREIFLPSDVADPTREAFYVDSHFPQSPLSGGYWLTIVPRLREFGWIILALCAGWLFRSKSAPVLRIIALTAVAVMLWNTVRESQNRFLLPSMVLLSAVAVGGAMSFPSQLMRRFAGVLLIAYSLFQITHHTLRLKESEVMTYLTDFYPAKDTPEDYAAGETPRESYLKKNLGDLGEVISDMNRQLPPAAKVLLLYEARPYLFNMETGYNVVWDDSVLLNIIRQANGVEDAWKLLAKAGFTHVLINRQELLRYIQQYARPSQLRPFGVRQGDDPRQAWAGTPNPEQLYPPFYRDRDWERLRKLVYMFLNDADNRATIRRGIPVPSPAVQPIDIIVVPVPHI